MLSLFDLILLACCYMSYMALDSVEFLFVIYLIKTVLNTQILLLEYVRYGRVMFVFSGLSDMQF